MKKTWTLTYESIPGDGEITEKYRSFADVKRKIRELIANIGVDRYYDEIRDGINIPYRNAMVSFLEDYVSRDDFYHVGDNLPSDDIADYPFEAPKIKNDSDMYVDDDHWYDEDEETDALDDLIVSIQEDDLVFEFYDGNVFSLRTNMVVMDNDEETYSFQYFAEGAAENKFSELTIELELTLNQQWGTSAYPLLILLALQNSEEHLKQSRLAIETSIERKAIGRNITLLKKIGFDIRHDGKGYYLPKKTSALDQDDIQAIVECISTNEALDDDRKWELIDKLSGI